MTIAVLAVALLHGSATTLRPSGNNERGIETTTRNPLEDPLYTGTGSIWEYAIRNLIRNFHYSPRLPPSTDNTPPIPDIFQKVYWYHMQQMHMDLEWIRSWQNLRPNQEPNLPFQLPSRNVTTHYQTDVNYQFGDDAPWTLDSHRLRCQECMRQFKCSGFLQSHLQDSGVEGQGWSVIAPTFLDTNLVANIPRNQPNAEEQNVACPAFVSSTSTTENFHFEGVSVEPKNYHHYDVQDHDELKRK